MDEPLVPKPTPTTGSFYDCRPGRRRLAGLHHREEQRRLAVVPSDPAHRGRAGQRRPLAQIVRHSSSTALRLCVASGTVGALAFCAGLPYGVSFAAGGIFTAATAATLVGYAGLEAGLMLM